MILSQNHFAQNYLNIGKVMYAIIMIFNVLIKHSNQISIKI